MRPAIRRSHGKLGRACAAERLSLPWLRLVGWHFRPNIQHAASVPGRPAYNHNVNPNAKPSPTGSTNPTPPTQALFERLAKIFYLTNRSTLG